jgi:hypothetical protein
VEDDERHTKQEQAVSDEQGGANRRTSLRDWIRRVGIASEPDHDLAPRHERRAEARHRHADGGPAWSEPDRHLNPDGPREVSDVAPGSPGFGPSRRTTRGR